MATAGPNNPSDSTGSSWVNSGNAYSSDDSWAITATPSAPLVLTGYGFSIPSGSTIDGVTVSIERHSDLNSKFAFITDFVVRLVIGGSATGSNKAATTTKWPTSDAVATYGGAADLWGLTPTVDQVNASDFGVYLSVSAAANAYVDAITVTVDYTEGGGGGISIPVVIHHLRQQGIA